MIFLMTTFWFVVVEIALDEFDAMHRLHRQQVERNQPPAGSHPFRSHLRPAAGRRTEVDHGHARPELLVLVVDLGQLERGTRPPPFDPGPLHIGVIDVLGNPGLGGLVLLDLLFALDLAAQVTIPS